MRTMVMRMMKDVKMMNVARLMERRVVIKMNLMRMKRSLLKEVKKERKEAKVKVVSKNANSNDCRSRIELIIYYHHYISQQFHITYKVLVNHCNVKGALYPSFH
jgi:hypothetical protein